MYMGLCACASVLCHDVKCRAYDLASSGTVVEILKYFYNYLVSTHLPSHRVSPFSFKVT